MSSAPWRRYEFAVVVLVVSVLALLLMQAIEQTRRQVEEAAMQSEVAALRIELLARVAHREVHGGGLPASDNPVLWAGRVPEGYRGEMAAPPAQGGAWYFDTGRGELIYRYRAGDEARFRLERRAGSPFSGGEMPGRLAGIGLRRVVSAERE